MRAKVEVGVGDAVLCDNRVGKDLTEVAQANEILDDEDSHPYDG